MHWCGSVHVFAKVQWTCDTYWGIKGIDAFIFEHLTLSTWETNIGL